MIDANNLYAGIMEKFPLPLCEFELFDKSEWTDDNAQEILHRILNTPDDDPVGYIVEVDLSYPDSLHDLHSDFPLAPRKEAIDECWLSEYQSNLLADMQIKKLPQVKKLIQTLFDKQNYTLHNQTLKLYVELGLVVTKLHRVLSIKQKKWLAPYVKLNTEKRKQVKNKFEEDFYKLMVNSSFGKTCEGKRNRMKVKLTRTEDETLKWTDKPEYQSSKVISENLVTVCLQQSEILWEKPTIVGACILNLAKKLMFEFHYKVMKKYFDCNLLYSDTDSFVYEVRSRDFVAEKQKRKQVADQFDYQTSLPSTLYTAGTMHESILNSKTRWEADQLLSFVDSNQSCIQSSSLKASLFHYPPFDYLNTSNQNNRHFRNFLANKVFLGYGKNGMILK